MQLILTCNRWPSAELLHAKLVAYPNQQEVPCASDAQDEYQKENAGQHNWESTVKKVRMTWTKLVESPFALVFRIYFWLPHGMSRKTAWIYGYSCLTKP